jgi:hypothetical protein
MPGQGSCLKIAPGISDKSVTERRAGRSPKHGDTAMHETDPFPTIADVATSAGTDKPLAATQAPGTGDPASPAAGGHQPDADTVDVKALFPDRSLHFVIDEDTRIIQTEILDTATGKVLQQIPEDSQLKRLAALREDARKAFVDTTA